MITKRKKHMDIDDGSDDSKWIPASVHTDNESTGRDEDYASLELIGGFVSSHDKGTDGTEELVS
jgi:hypothetical protein